MNEWASAWEWESATVSQAVNHRGSEVRRHEGRAARNTTVTYRPTPVLARVRVVSEVTWPISCHRSHCPALDWRRRGAAQALRPHSCQFSDCFPPGARVLSRCRLQTSYRSHPGPWEGLAAGAVLPDLCSLTCAREKIPFTQQGGDDDGM